MTDTQSEVLQSAEAVGSRFYRGGVAAIFLSAVVLRLLGANSRSIWYDEAFSILFAHHGPQAMIASTLADVGGVAADVHPVLYYTALWSWMGAFGDSLLAVRVLSILCGLLTLWITIKVARMQFGVRTALLGGFLVALSPFQIHYSQEIRMYALMTLFILTATWAILQALRTDGWYWWGGFAVSAALAQYTHNEAAIFLVCLAITPLLLNPVVMGRWKALRKTALAGLTAVLLYLPWLVRLPEQFAKIQTMYWTERPSPARLMTALLSYVANLPLPGFWLPVSLFVTLLCLALAGWQTFQALKAARQQAGKYVGAEPALQAGVWAAFMAFGPMFLLFLISQWQPVFIERALLPSGIFFLLWLAWALSSTGLPRLFTGVSLGVLIIGQMIGIGIHLTYQGFPYAPYEALDAYLMERDQPGDVILHSNKLSILPMVYYAPGLPQRYIADPPGSGSDTLSLPTQEVLGLIAAPNVEAAVQDALRVRLVIFQRAIQEYQSMGEKTHPQIVWLDAHFHQTDIQQWGDLLLIDYAR